MLTTRCPDCDTKFRITSVALHRASGQVRCGQCSCVFNAFDSLTDTLTQIQAAELLAGTITEIPEPEPDAEPTPAAQPLPDARVEEVLEDEPPPPQETWHPSEPESAPESPRWRIAAAAAACLLALQGAHHFRGDLATVPVIGGAVGGIYSLIGNPIVQPTDPADFTIVNWVATARELDEADDAAPSSLAISAGVRNTSDEAQPYPMLSLELTDRWEETIAARVFTPDEYMGTRLSRTARIRPNTTVTAEFQLVDPGPDAYGFEVDICIAIDAERMHCKKSYDPFQ
jgi:predicted Zn finger-like uncharacterized protein